MRLSEEINALQAHVDALQDVLDSLKKRIERVDKSWPDHQIIPSNDWHDRNEIPPEGRIWASDGIRIWLISSDGKGIDDGATAVKYWSIAFIPHPPNK